MSFSKMWHKTVRILVDQTTVSRNANGCENVVSSHHDGAYIGLGKLLELIGQMVFLWCGISFRCFGLSSLCQRTVGVQSFDRTVALLQHAGRLFDQWLALVNDGVLVQFVILSVAISFGQRLIENLENGFDPVQAVSDDTGEVVGDLGVLLLLLFLLLKVREDFSFFVDELIVFVDQLPFGIDQTVELVVELSWGDLAQAVLLASTVRSAQFSLVIG